MKALSDANTIKRDAYTYATDLCFAYSPSFNILYDSTQRAH